MLTQQDLRQIGDLLIENNKTLKTEIVTEVVEQVVERVGEMIEQNVLPEFERLENTLPSKGYIDEKISGLRAEFVVQRRGLA